MQSLPPGPAALDAVLAAAPDAALGTGACDRGRPGWTGGQDERHLGGDQDGQLAVHRRILATARAGGPLRVAMARIAAAILSRDVWKRLSYVRLGDYARERLGISRRELQEFGRVGARLDRLPGLEAALAGGQVCWSKARLIAQVARRCDEAEWIAFAKGATTKELEDKVHERAGAEKRGIEPREEDIPTGTFQVACTTRARGLWHRLRQCANQLRGYPVSATECIEMLTAEVRAAIDLEPFIHDQPPRWPDDEQASRGYVPSPGLAESAVEPAAGDTELPSSVCELLHTLTDGLERANPWELDRRLQEALRRERQLDSRVGALLSIVQKKWIYRAYQYSSVVVYAEELLGFSKSKAEKLLKIERAVQVCPPLARVYRSGELSWARAELLSRVVRADTLGRWWEAWIAWAKKVSVRRLEDDVKRERLLRETDVEAWSRTGGLPADAHAQGDGASPEPDPQTCASCTIGFRAECEMINSFWLTLDTVRRRTQRLSGVRPTLGEAFEAMMEYALREWGADAKVRREHRIMARDGWRCLVPGCSSYRNLHAHHIVLRSQGGGDEDANQLTLCVAHHLRGVHGGTLEITGKAPDELVFKLGIRRNGPPLAVYRSGEILVEPQP
ncbi:MAG: hypothetical protein V3V67_01750 [Myxococcota bacterium]